MSNFTKFILGSKFIFTHEQDGSVVSHTTEQLSATEVTRQFYYFMLGSGFGHISILDAFQNLQEEHVEKQDWPDTDPNDGGMNL